MHGQYQSCWWLVDARSQVISTHGTDLDLPEYSSFSTKGVKGFWEWHLHLASNCSKLYLWEIKSLAWKEAQFPPRLSLHTGYISHLIEMNMLNGNGHGIFGIHFTNSLRAYNLTIVKYMLVICDAWWSCNGKNHVAVKVTLLGLFCFNYNKFYNVRHAKSQNMNISHLGLQLSLSNRLKPSVQWRMKM